MNWKERYNRLQPGTKVKVINLAMGEVSFCKGDILIIKKYRQNDRTHGPEYTTEKHDNVFLSEIEVVK